MVSPYEPESFARIVSFVLDAGWAWAGLAVVAGWIARTPRQGAVAGVTALLTATTAYFTFDSVNRDESLGAYSAEMLRWWLVSVSLGWVLGVIGAYARRGDVVGLVAALVVPLGAVVQMIVLPPGPGGPATTAAMGWTRLLVITTAVIVAAAAVARFVRHLRRPSQRSASGEAIEFLAPRALRRVEPDTNRRDLGNEGASEIYEAGEQHKPLHEPR